MFELGGEFHIYCCEVLQNDKNPCELWENCEYYFKQEMNSFFEKIKSWNAVGNNENDFLFTVGFGIGNWYFKCVEWCISYESRLINFF